MRRACHDNPRETAKLTLCVAQRPAHQEELTSYLPCVPWLPLLRRAPAEQGSRLPPGQYVTEGFPELSVGPATDLAGEEVDVLDHPEQPGLWRHGSTVPDG